MVVFVAEQLPEISYQAPAVNNEAFGIALLFATPRLRTSPKPLSPKPQTLNPSTLNPYKPL